MVSTYYKFSLSLHNILKFILFHQVALIIVSIGTIALILRLVNLENWPRWYADEGTYAIAGTGYVEGLWGNWYRHPAFGAPLLILILGTITNILGKSYLYIRLPGIISGTVSCILLYLIGSKIYNRKIGAISAISLSISTLYVNRVVLQDNLAELFLLATIYLYLTFHEKETYRRAYLIGITAGLALLAKYSGLAAIIIIMLFSLIDNKFHKTKTSLITFSTIAITLPITGLIFGWNHFITDLLAYIDIDIDFNATGFLNFLMMSYPDNQLNWKTHSAITYGPL